MLLRSFKKPLVNARREQCQGPLPRVLALQLLWAMPFWPEPDEKQCIPHKQSHTSQGLYIILTEHNITIMPSAWMTGFVHAMMNRAQSPFDFQSTWQREIVQARRGLLAVARNRYVCGVIIKGLMREVACPRSLVKFCLHVLGLLLTPMSHPSSFLMRFFCLHIVSSFCPGSVSSLVAWLRSETFKPLLFMLDFTSGCHSYCALSGQKLSRQSSCRHV